MTPSKTTKRKNSAPADTGFSLISNQKLLSIYAVMLACRKMAADDASSAKPARTSKSLRSMRGLEAAAVGMTIDLGHQDTLTAPLWPEVLLRAINPHVKLASQLPLKAMQLPSGAAPSVALWFAKGKQARQGRWLKAMRHAAVHRLPILFVSLNVAGSEELAASAGKTSAAEGRPDVPCITVDGSDVVAMYRVSSEFIAHARRGLGPTLIECWIETGCDPLDNMAQYLVRKGLGAQGRVE